MDNPEPQTELKTSTPIPGKPLSEWSDEELRVKVAELCGWKCTELSVSHGSYEYHWHNPQGEQCARNALPNYPADLNAMHEAKKVMPLYLRPVFAKELARVILEGRDPTEEGKVNLVWMRKFADATARQQAEALVATLGNSHGKH